MLRVGDEQARTLAAWALEGICPNGERFFGNAAAWQQLWEGQQQQ